MARRSLEDTWRHLQTLGIVAPRAADGSPIVPRRTPAVDDEEPLGLRFVRKRLQDMDLSDCSLARTFFGRSDFHRVSVRDADLTASRMCWNDFEDCDFSMALLIGCDLRASRFDRCQFTGAVLRGTDLRRSSFTDCDFTGADLTGAIAHAGGGLKLLLSGPQQAGMQWPWELGEEPAGG